VGGGGILIPQRKINAEPCRSGSEPLVETQYETRWEVRALSQFSFVSSLDSHCMVTMTSVTDPNPGSGMGKKKIRIWIRDEHPGSYFRRLEKQFFGLKYLNSFMRIWKFGIFLTLDPGWKKFSFASPRLTLYCGNDVIREVQLLEAGEAGECVPTHRLDGVPGQAQPPQLL
jgi:hypothetical protein